MDRRLPAIVALFLIAYAVFSFMNHEPAEAHHRCGHQGVVCTPTVTSTFTPTPTPTLVPTATNTAVPTPTPTATSVPPSPTPTSIAPTSTPTSTPTSCTQVTSLTLQSGQSLSNYCVSNPNGDCVTGPGVSNVTLTNFQVGPCNGAGILFWGSSFITIQDSTVHTDHAATGCCDTYDGIAIYNSNNVTIQRNTVSRSETNIEVQFSATVNLLNNTLRDPLGPMPRGNQIQIVGRPYGAPSTDVLVQGNTTRSSAPDAMTTDHISIAGSDRITVRSNDVRGYAPGAIDSACQIIADYYNTYVTIEANFASGLPGVGGTQCGMSNANGQNVWINNNEVWDTTNVAFTVWNAEWYSQYPPCFGIHVTLNRAMNRNNRAPFWYDGVSCGAVEESGNDWPTP